MGNRVTFARRPDLATLKMSNDLTSVVMGVLSLAASELAGDERERDLAAWMASRDQHVLGLGNVGFDLDDMPWRSETWSRDKAFLLTFVDAASHGLGWEKLGYEPNADWVLESLTQLRALFAAFAVDTPADRSVPISEVIDSDPTRCERHGIYHHAHGCVLCNEHLRD